LVNTELHLRQGQLNDTLHQIQIALGYKSYIFRNDICPAFDLGATSSLLDQYKGLTWQHLSVSTSIISPQVHGQRNKSLPWFWTMDVRRDADVGEWMEDCTSTSLFTLNQDI
ncbi:hypothetical protein EI94DRAFT_1611771, partial [Lactarius quietus]